MRAVAVVILAFLAACGPHAGARDAGRQPTKTAATAELEPAMARPVGSATTDWAVRDPGPLRGKLLTADVLVVGKGTLPASLRKKLRSLRGVRMVNALSLASVPVADRSITVAGVDAKAFRRYVPAQAAKMDAVWQAVASGDALVSHAIGKDLRQPLGGKVVLHRGRAELPVRIGAYATTVPAVDAVVNERRREQLGMASQNALLVSVNEANRADATEAIRARVGKLAQVQQLPAAVPAQGTGQAAGRYGSALSSELGSFTYQYFPDGTVKPEAGWVAANIRTESVPILGRVTCHRVMLPQLHAALSEIVRQGLADTINPNDYGGCYYPRFIGYDRSRGLSLHTWGIAIDFNVAGNPRGTAGEIDRRVVAIFKRWGFAWGGDWEWTDPMHFELAAIVRS